MLTTTTKANYTFTTDGTGLWGCEEGRTVTITGFDVQRYDAEDAAEYDWCEEGDIMHVSVEHDSTWDVYTDKGFREAARFVTGIADLDFTEQGMQHNGIASMEI
jgi:hypothetical protein